MAAAANDKASATAATRRIDCNHNGPPPFAAAHGLHHFWLGRQPFKKFLKTFILRLASRINHYPISRPCVILTAQHGLPRRKNKVGNARLSGLDAPLMLECIGTNDLNVDAPCL